MSNEKDQSLLGAAPPQPPTAASSSAGAEISNASGQHQQPPPPPPYSQFPVQNPGYYGAVPMQPQQQQYPGGPIYPHIPPPYSDPAKQNIPPPMNPNQPPPPYQPMMQAVYPGQQQQVFSAGSSVCYGYPGGYMPYQPYQPYQYQVMAPQLPPNMAVVMPDGFDASARFDGIARASVPPPPPGVAPNMAQLAMLSGQGNQVIIGQKKPKFW